MTLFSCVSDFQCFGRT